MQNNVSLHELHIAELKLLSEVDRVCKKNNINYSLDGGTALGAVRHQGFIPWDDDIDVCMTRVNYERFLSICSLELGEECYLQTMYTDSNYKNPYAKIRINNTTYLEKETEHDRIHHGIYIDIFPFDNLPNNRVMRYIYTRLLRQFQRLVLCSLRSDVSSTSKLKKLVSKIIVGSKGLYRLDRYAKVYQREDSQFCMCFPYWDSYHNYRYRFFPSFWLNETVRIKFETLSASIMKYYHQYLELIFGDYMTMPPVEERITHTPITVSIEKGDCK